MKGFTMLKENQNEVEVIALNAIQEKQVKDIVINLKESHGSRINADERMNTAVSLMLKLLGLKPDYNLLKQVQQVMINSLVNDHKLALTTAEKLFSQMLKQLKFANDKFIKPKKETEASIRMDNARKELKKKYEHEALESIEAKLAKVNKAIGQAFIDNVKPKEEDISLQKELTNAKKLKQGKVDSEAKDLQKSNIDKLRSKIESMLKIDTGRFNKKGNPIFEWSIVKLDFVYRCLENQEAIKKFLAEKK